jgi:hypothetical protein
MMQYPGLAPGGVLTNRIFPVGFTGADLLARLNERIAVLEGQPNGAQLAARLRAVRDQIVARQDLRERWNPASIERPIRPEGGWGGPGGENPASRPTPPEGTPSADINSWMGRWRGQQGQSRAPIAAPANLAARLGTVMPQIGAPQLAARQARLQQLLAGTPVANIIRRRLGV